MSLTFLSHNLCEGFNALLLKSILNPIFPERFIGGHKPRWLALPKGCIFRTSSPLALLAATLLSFLTALFFLDGIGRKFFSVKSTFTYPTVKCEPSQVLQRADARRNRRSGFQTCHQANYVYYEGTRANFRINKQIHRHQVIKSAKNRQSHYPRGRLALNQNYTRCIFIRTDCEI